MRLIDADELIRMYFDDEDGNKTFEFVPAEFIDSAPTVDAEPIKHGRWRHYEGTLTCSVCHTEIYDDIMELLGDDVPRYCPNCGARMDEVEK